jgi:hypothetical protein
MDIQKQHHFDIEKLINEARELGCNIHDYVALRLYGHVTDKTRKAAKNAAFNWLYSGEGKAYKNFAVQVEAMSEAAKKNFDRTYDRIAVKEMQDLYDSVDTSREDAALQRLADTPFKMPQPTYKQYTIKVKGDDEYSAVCYSVPALSAQAARVLAFALYGGFGTFKEAEPVLQDDDIELALTWTEVIV